MFGINLKIVGGLFVLFCLGQPNAQAVPFSLAESVFDLTTLQISDGRLGKVKGNVATSIESDFVSTEDSRSNRRNQLLISEDETAFAAAGYLSDDFLGAQSVIDGVPSAATFSSAESELYSRIPLWFNGSDDFTASIDYSLTGLTNNDALAIADVTFALFKKSSKTAISLDENSIVVSSLLNQTAFDENLGTLSLYANSLPSGKYFLELGNRVFSSVEAAAVRVPEPSTFPFLIFAIALLYMAWRKSTKGNSPLSYV